MLHVTRCYGGSKILNLVRPKNFKFLLTFSYLYVNFSVRHRKLIRKPCPLRNKDTKINYKPKKCFFFGKSSICWRVITVFSEKHWKIQFFFCLFPTNVLCSFVLSLLLYKIVDMRYDYVKDYKSGRKIIKFYGGFLCIGAVFEINFKFF